MSHRFAALVVVLVAVLLTASLAAIWVGATDWIVAAAGPRRAIDATALPAAGAGWFATEACVRHDLAVVVTAEGVAYRLGEAGPASDDGDRVYTPLAARDDCDDERPPRAIYALLEDAESSGTTLGRAAPRRFAPPPIPARVEGTVGPRVGDRGRAAKARRKLTVELASVADVPLLRKDGRPGDRRLAMFTIGAGAHGLLLLALGARYVRRRARRRAALLSGQLDDAEEQFFRTETL